jgi:hypothetical protein
MQPKPMNIGYIRQQNSPAAAPDSSSTSIPIIAVMASVLAFLVIVTLALEQTQSAVLLGIVILGLVMMRPQTGIVVTFVYLAFLGDLRRYLWVYAGPIANDPLLLIAPAVAAWLCATAMLRHQLKLNTPVSKLLVGLMAVMTLQVFNPLQGGVSVGMVGVLMYIVPMLWFWVGKTYGSPEFVEKIFYRVVVPISVPAALLGLLQTMVGFFSFEATFIRVTRMNSVISVGKAPRPFSFFVSPQEYSCYIAIALLAVVLPLAMKRVRLSLLLLPLLATALVLGGSRGPIVYFLLAISVVWAVQARRSAVVIARGCVAVLVGVVGISYLASEAQDMQFSEQADPYIHRQIDGFLKPEDSTAGVHGTMVLEGIESGITNPIGLGLGATTLASKTGGATEIDISNMFVCLGMIGGLYYLLVVVKIFRQSIVTWQRTRTLAALLVVGTAVLLIGNWLNGVLYAVCPLIWFAIGAMDKSFAQTKPQPVPASASARPARIMPHRRLLPARGQHA